MRESVAFGEWLAVLEQSWQGLPDKPEEAPEPTLCALAFAAVGQPRAIERALWNELPVLSGQQLERLGELVEKRAGGTPLAHLTGRQQFMGLEMLASPAGLIPRKETEILGYAALEKLQKLIAERGSATVIDVGCGSGNLALALAHHAPGCRVYGSDISAEAVELAQSNARFLGLQDRVEFLVGDFFEPFDRLAMGPVDMIVCNPPYISSGQLAEMPAEIAEYEPSLAFDGGPFGVKFLMRLLKEAPAYLREGSWLCFEVGLGQGKVMEARTKKTAGLSNVESLCIAKGQIRAILALACSNPKGCE